MLPKATKLTPAFELTNTKREIQTIYRNYLEISFFWKLYDKFGKMGHVNLLVL